MTLISELKKLLKGETQTIRQIVVALVVLALDKLITSEHLFQCPVIGKGNDVYAWIFIILPAVIIFALALLMTEDFRKIIQGWCYNDDPAIRQKTYFICRRPRWNCCKTTRIVTLLFNGTVAGCLWICWAFLQAKYYTCAVLGDEDARKEEVKGNKTETKKVEELFVNTRAESQTIGLVLLTVVVIIPTVILAAYRCCFKNSFSAIPSLEEYLKLEEDAAVTTYKEKVKELAEAEGKKNAEKSFKQEIADDDRKSTSETLEDIHNKLQQLDDFRGTRFSTPYKEEAAAAEKEAFDAKLKEEAKAKIKRMVESEDVTKREIKDSFALVENAHETMIQRYPRLGGDHSRPYVKIEQHEDGELQEL